MILNCCLRSRKKIVVNYYTYKNRKSKQSQVNCVALSVLEKKIVKFAKNSKYVKAFKLQCELNA